MTVFERELYQRTSEVLHYVWDPIGVAHEPAARDEYDSYLPIVVSMLRDPCRHTAIAAALLQIERDRMGLAPDAQRADMVMAVLVDWMIILMEKYRDA